MLLLSSMINTLQIIKKDCEQDVCEILTQYIQDNDSSRDYAIAIEGYKFGLELIEDVLDAIKCNEPGREIEGEMIGNRLDVSYSEEDTSVGRFDKLLDELSADLRYDTDFNFGTKAIYQIYKERVLDYRN